MATTKQTVSFAGAEGAELQGIVESPQDRPRAFALFAHCFTCTKDFLAPARISRALAERGIAVLRFDFTGLGQSCGEFSQTSFPTNVRDVQAAAAFLGQHLEPPRLLLGHSLGGTAVLAAAHSLPEAAGVVTLAAPKSPLGLRRLLAPIETQLQERGEAEVTIGGRTVTLGQRFFDEIDSLDMEELIAQLDAQLLLIHSPHDDTVPIAVAEQIFQRAPQPKNFIALPGADHLFSRPQDANSIAAIIDAWSAPWL
jgi:putative redox protein